MFKEALWLVGILKQGMWLVEISNVIVWKVETSTLIGCDCDAEIAMWSAGKLKQAT